MQLRYNSSFARSVKLILIYMRPELHDFAKYEMGITNSVAPELESSSA
jgi:hypothetical protein